MPAVLYKVVGPFWTLASDDWINTLTRVVLAHFPGICCAVRLTGYTRTRYPHHPRSWEVFTQRRSVGLRVVVPAALIRARPKPRHDEHAETGAQRRTYCQAKQEFHRFPQFCAIAKLSTSVCGWACIAQSFLSMASSPIDGPRPFSPSLRKRGNGRVLSLDICVGVVKPDYLLDFFRAILSLHSPPPSLERAREAGRCAAQA